LEVSQIARTISRALNINEDLTEAISLGHDLGHTPFGHTGEDALNELYEEGYRHNEQSLRIVNLLENNGSGLNLTWEVRDGILNHSKTRIIDILGENWGKANTLEGEVCKIADVIAYINHDIDDAIRAGIIKGEDLPSESTCVLGYSRSERINTMVSDVVNSSWAIRGDSSLIEPAIMMSPIIQTATRQLHEFLYQKVYIMSSSQPEAEKARKIVCSLYHFFINHLDLLPTEYFLNKDRPERKVVDYIASMTDQYAQRKALELNL
jgi:dGTPase